MVVTKRSPKEAVKSKVLKVVKKSQQYEASVAKIPAFQYMTDNLPNNDDYLVKYFFTNNPDQAGRDWVAQAMAFYSIRSKRQACPEAGEVTENLPDYVQGITANLTAATAMTITYKAAKHIWATGEYISSMRNQHGNITVNVSVDGSPFLTIL